MDTKVQMLRIQDVAKKLNVSQKSVRRYIHSGKLRSNKIGGVHRIEASDLRSFLELSIHKNEKRKRMSLIQENLQRRIRSIGSISPMNGMMFYLTNILLPIFSVEQAVWPKALKWQALNKYVGWTG